MKHCLGGARGSERQYATICAVAIFDLMPWEGAGTTEQCSTIDMPNRSRNKNNASKHLNNFKTRLPPPRLQLR
eukprot:4071973-Amphidinium_carterae.1